MYEAALFKAAFTLAFSALLRIGEFALSKGNSQHIIIHIGDMTFSNKGELIKLCIRHSKTDQQGYGTSVAVHATSGIACPEAAMRNFLQIQSFQGHYFVTFPVNQSLVSSLAQY